MLASVVGREGKRTGHTASEMMEMLMLVMMLYTLVMQIQD